MANVQVVQGVLEGIGVHALRAYSYRTPFPSIFEMLRLREEESLRVSLSILVRKWLNPQIKKLFYSSSLFYWHFLGGAADD